MRRRGQRQDVETAAAVLAYELILGSLRSEAGEMANQIDVMARHLSDYLPPDPDVVELAKLARQLRVAADALRVVASS